MMKIQKCFSLIFAVMLAASITGCSNSSTTEGSHVQSSKESSVQQSSEAESSVESSKESSVESSVESSQESSEEESKPEEINLSDVYSAYGEVVKRLQADHGTASTSSNSGMSGYATGLAIVRLIDFNGDGTEELLCAYNETADSMFANHQEIFTYADGQAVSVYSGTVNYEGGVGPFVEYLLCADNAYLLTDSVSDSFTRGTWMSFDGSAFSSVLSYKGSDSENLINDKTVTPDAFKTEMESFLSKGDRQHLTIYPNGYDLGSLLTDTQQVIDKLMSASSAANTDDTSTANNGGSLEQAKQIYSSYIASGKWRSYTAFGEDIQNDTKLLEPEYAVFDFNGDGNYEMLLFSKGTDTGPRQASHSEFCTIENGEVKRLLSAAESAGTMGGNNIRLRYDDSTDKFYIGDGYYSGGWGGQASGSTLYTMSSGGSLEQVLKIDQSIEFNGNEEYKLDDKNTTKEELETISKRLHSVFDMSVVDKLYNETSDKSNMERLKELGVIQ